MTRIVAYDACPQHGSFDRLHSLADQNIKYYGILGSLVKHKWFKRGRINRLTNPVKFRPGRDFRMAR